MNTDEYVTSADQHASQLSPNFEERQSSLDPERQPSLIPDDVPERQSSPDPERQSSPVPDDVPEKQSSLVSDDRQLSPDPTATVNSILAEANAFPPISPIKTPIK